MVERGTLPELDRLQRVLDRLRHPLVSVGVIHTERFHKRNFPIHTITLGHGDARQRPACLLMAGVHGLERIGSQVVIAYLETLASRLRWDEQFLNLLERIRIVVLPLFNPVGVVLHHRANARGVDLMRNAPVESKEPAHPLAFYRGHRLTPHLPCYRGRGLEPEVIALERFFRENLFPARPLVSLDVHSGFGTRDQIWFPYAHTRQAFPSLAEVMALTQIFEEGHPHHRYVVEPQSRRYTAHGDLWDYFYDIQRTERPGHVFLPLTLEIASWNWIRKNPRQSLWRLGLFHPMKPHRVDRVLRRHLSLFDFLGRITAAPGAWTGFNDAMRHTLEHEAHKAWPELE